MRLVDIAEHQYIPEREFRLMLQQLLLDRATKKNLHFKDIKNNSIDIYYLSTNNGTLYITFLELNDQNKKPPSSLQRRR